MRIIEYFRQNIEAIATVAFFIALKGGDVMAKGKYREWLEPDNLLRLEAWARDGLTDEQIAQKMGVNIATLYEWKKKYPEISEALKKGKDVIDCMVENALLKRAFGYEYEEIIEERIFDTGQKARHGGAYELTNEDWETCRAYFNNECAYCGSRSNLTKDHLDPLHNGGKLIRENVVPACKSCNSSKKANQWLAWYQKQDFYDKQKAAKITEYVTFASLLPKRQDEFGAMVVTKKVIKHMPPDTTAQIFWLKNRKPKEWRDAKNVEMNATVNNPFDGVTTEDIKKLIGDG